MIPTIEDFIANWEAPFRKVHDALNMLSRIPREDMIGFHPGNVITFEERLARQEDWLYETTAMDDMEEKFFQHYWVPVQQHINPWYIDLTLPELPVFSIFYIDHSPKMWHRYILWDSVTSLILAAEAGINWKDFGRNQLMTEIKLTGEVSDQRDQLILEGKYPIWPVTLEEVFVEGIRTEPITDLEMDSLILLNALPLSIGLFDPETPISLDSVKCEDPERYADRLEKITLIRHFMVFLRQSLQEDFPLFQFNLVGSEVAVWHNEKNELIVIGADKELIGKLLDAVAAIPDTPLDEL